MVFFRALKGKARGSNKRSDYQTLIAIGILFLILALIVFIFGEGIVGWLVCVSGAVLAFILATLEYIPTWKQRQQRIGRIKDLCKHLDDCLPYVKNGTLKEWIDSRSLTDEIILAMCLMAYLEGNDYNVTKSLTEYSGHLKPWVDKYLMPLLEKTQRIEE